MKELLIKDKNRVKNSLLIINELPEPLKNSSKIIRNCKILFVTSGYERKLLKKGKNMGKNSVFHNLLTINDLAKTPKIVPKMFGFLVVFSYLCNVSIINRSKL